MKRRNNTIIILIASIIIISNLPPITYFLQEAYRYQNKDGSFQFEENGTVQSFDVAKARFNSFKNKNPDNPNKILYRTFTLKPWRFWEWWQMIIHFERFRLPIHPMKD
jgi:hypothetical protein